MKPASETSPEPDSGAPVAAIDVGTNTLRLLIARFGNGRIERSGADRAVTRLGKGLISTGLLNKKGREESIASLLRFKALCEKNGVKRIIALGTSALREAGDSREFIQEALERTGISIDVISGDREAELTVKAIEAAVDISPRNHRAPALVLDIGGGSTEWIVCSTSIIKESTPLGSVKLQEQFPTADPPSSGELEKIKTYIHEAVSASLFKHGVVRAGQLFATGGTATTVAAVDLGLATYNGDLVHLHTLSRPTLEAIFQRLAALPLKDRAAVKGLEPERADTIIYGIMTLLAFMDALKVKAVTVSDYGLLEGAIIEEDDAEKR